jgi:hypothetical protein
MKKPGVRDFTLDQNTHTYAQVGMQKGLWRVKFISCQLWPCQKLQTNWAEGKHLASMINKTCKQLINTLKRWELYAFYSFLKPAHSFLMCWKLKHYNKLLHTQKLGKTSNQVSLKYPHRHNAVIASTSKCKYEEKKRSL